MGDAMTVDPLGQSLHEKATRGTELTREEQTSLQQWYSQLDQQEEAILAKSTVSPDTLQPLRNQVDGALAEIAASALKIQAQEAENQRLREEIEALKRLLAQKLTLRSA